MKHHIFRRIFVTHVIVLLLSVLFIELYITNIVRNNYLTDLKKSLFIQANLISKDITFKTAKKLDNLSRQLKQETNARITLIDSNGKVLQSYWKTYNLEH